MNYLLKDQDGKIITGEITYLHITPFYEFEIEIDGCKLNCYLDHLLSEWHLCIADYEIDVELAHPTDIFWNTNAIFERIEDKKLSLQIAYAVNTVYKERNYSEDVL